MTFLISENVAPRITAAKLQAPSATAALERIGSQIYRLTAL
jgi:hypothetical protein